MDKRPISDLMDTTMQKVREMIDANTIVGEPVTTADGITLIPVSKLSFGFVGGGSDFAKKQETPNGFGGGIGAGVKIEPVAFIVATGENVRLLHVSPPAATTLDRVIETVPEIIDKIKDFFDKDKDDE
ncbi:MAG: GerW family sporulation protein [Oscillospiraceae bacterium]|nr:GerW family sporulation protein [Oscillospiraceae bacterium]